MNVYIDWISFIIYFILWLLSLQSKNLLKNQQAANQNPSKFNHGPTSQGNPTQSILMISAIRIVLLPNLLQKVKDPLWILRNLWVEKMASTILRTKWNCGLICLTTIRFILRSNPLTISNYIMIMEFVNANT